YITTSLAIVSMILGEITHDVGRLPYMVIIGESGLDVSLFINRLIIIEPALLIVGIASILVMTSIFMMLLYRYLVKGFIE
ncbi:MAG: hypothetical protein N3F06_02430, partial [Nitrososphaerales archaeon]|nr:hypothetical protein [Nitrososphaerales archaeon]